MTCLEIIISWNNSPDCTLQTLYFCFKKHACLCCNFLYKTPLDPLKWILLDPPVSWNTDPYCNAALHTRSGFKKYDHSNAYIRAWIMYGLLMLLSLTHTYTLHLHPKLQAFSDSVSFCHISPAALWLRLVVQWYRTFLAIYHFIVSAKSDIITHPYELFVPEAKMCILDHMPQYQLLTHMKADSQG